jgi:hypothetical protein
VILKFGMAKSLIKNAFTVLISDHIRVIADRFVVGPGKIVLVLRPVTPVTRIAIL